MQVTFRPARSVFFLFWTVLLILASPQWSVSQPTLLLDFSVLGGAIETNPDNPDQPPLLTFFVGQPAVIELIITNLSEESQSVSAGGGGGGGFVFESATVADEAGSCEVDESQTFFECTEVDVPGTAAGKSAELHNTRQVMIEVRILEVSTGGFSFFVHNLSTDEAHSTAASAQFTTETQTHTLTVESLPPLVDIAVTPGDLGNTMFSREYPVGTNVRLRAPQEIDVLITPLFFVSWSVDGGEPQENDGITVVMDADHTAFAEYGVPTLMGLMPLSSGKRVGPVDVYANGIRIVDDLAENQVTPFRVVALEATIEITDGAAQDNSNPLMSFPYESDGTPAHIILTESDHFINQNARTAAVEPDQTDVALFLQLSSQTEDAIRVVHRSASTDTELFGPDSPADENGFTPYASLPPGEGVVEILDRADGTQFEAFQGELAEGGAVLGVLRENAGRGGLGFFTLLLFDAEGSPVETAVVTSTADEGTMPSSFALHGNYPNPFNPETVIRFEVATGAHVRLQVLNSLGQIVETLIDGLHDPGTYSATFEAADLPSGAYFYRMTAGAFEVTRPMILMR